MTSAEQFTGPTTELLQALIRNECVNDGTPDSGNEVRNADLLQTYLEGAGLDVQRFDSRPGRTSIVARIEGSDPSAPTLCLMGHTDVVPVNPDGWSRDPFGGELVDGEVWGRGAIDMLNITSSMAVAFRQLASEGFRPKGTLIYFGVADEEAGGQWGAEYMIDEHWDAVGADYVLTESGGWSMVDHDGTRHVTVNVAEKGLSWRRLRVARHAGSRFDAVRRRQRVDHGRRDRPPPRDVPHAVEPRRPLAGEAGGDGHPRRPAGGAVGSGDDRRRPGHAAGELRQGRPRLHAHDDLAQRDPRRAEDEHDPRRHRHRRRHAHGRRATPRRSSTATSPRHSAIWPTASRCHRCRRATPPARRWRTPCGTPWRRARRRRTQGRRSFPG